jgi:hypothetical protein
MKMSVNEGPIQAKWSDRVPVISEMAWLATVAVAFLLVHILAGTILLQAPSGAITPPQEAARPSYSD